MGPRPGIPGCCHDQLSILVKDHDVSSLLESYKSGLLDDEYEGNNSPTIAKTDESSGLMVIATDRMLTLLQNYRRVLTNPPYRPILFVHIDLTHPIGCPTWETQQDEFQGDVEHFADLWQDHYGRWEWVCRGSSHAD